MALISPVPGSQISLSDILSKMGLSTSNRNLNSVELSAMGGYPNANSAFANGLCMPHQIEATASIGSTGTGATGAKWTATSLLWRPNRMSEFRNAYNSKPVASGSASGTGSSSSCTLVVNGSNSDAYSSISTPYYFYVTGSGSFTGKNTWVVASQNNGTRQTYNVSGLAGSGSFTCYVQDFSGCGNKFEFFSNISY